jgi:calcium/calmodulin-dependent protein kinase kinase 2
VPGPAQIFATGNEYLERCNGTPAFLAPEMMKPNSRFRGRPTDVYALGACLYTLVYGRIPFSAPNLYKLFQVRIRALPWWLTERWMGEWVGV